MPTTKKPELESVFFASPAEMEAWLERHHATSPGVWLEMAKKGTGIPSVTYAEAVEVALCFGWIDGQSKRIDDARYRQRFTPRAPRSIWSKVHREKVAALKAAGRMRPAGLREVERAQADGRWDAAYDSPSRASVPEDLAAALAQNEAASRFFATLDAQNRYSVLHRIQTAKKAETRAKRVAQFVEMLARGEKLYP